MIRKTKEQIERDEQIYHLTTLVAGEFSLQEALDRLAEAAVRITLVKACSIRLLDENAGELEMRSTYGLSEEYRNKGVVSKNDKVIKAAFAGEAVVLDDMRVDGRVKYKEAAIKEGLISQLTVAMRFRKRQIGVLRLYSPTPKRFDEDAINLARAVASQCAAAITNARLYAEAVEGERIAEQMRLAGVIQRRMIPKKAPALPGFDIAAEYIPCFDIGGDLYSFFKFDEGCTTIAIADVIGKGIPAAIMMSSFRGAVQAYVDSIRDTPAYCDCNRRSNCHRDMVYRINKMACDSCRDGEFITFFYAAINVNNMTLTYCNCGHEPALLIRDGKIRDLETGGLVLGIDRDAEYETETIELKGGDCLMFYTDGLIDAVDFDGQPWGRDRLIKAARKYAADTAEQMVKNILAYRRRFVGLARQVDDTSIIIVKVDAEAKAKA